MNGMTTAGFDYGDLTDSEQKHLERQADRIADARRVVAKSAVETGRVLSEVRDRLANRGNGTFDKWVEQRCGITPRHARNFIATFEAFGEEPENVFRNFDDSSLFLLSTPAAVPARKEALKIAVSGKIVTHKLAKAILEKHRPSVAPDGYTGHGLPTAGKNGGAKRRDKASPVKEPAESAESGQQADDRGGFGTAPTAGPSLRFGFDDPVREPPRSGPNIIETTGRVISPEVPTLPEILAAINHASRLIDRYAASDEGREMPIDKATKAIRDLKAAIAGGGSPHVIAEDVEIDPSLDSADVRSALNNWLIYKRKRNQPYKDAGQVALQMKRWVEAGPAAFIAAVEYSIAQNYQGITPDKGGGTGTPRKTAAPAGAVTAGSFGETYDPFAA